MTKIFRKTLVAVILVFGISANATALLSAWLLHRHLTDEYLAKGRTIALAIAAASPDALRDGDIPALQAMLDEFARIEGVGYAIIVNGQGEVVVHTATAALVSGVPAAPVARSSGFSSEDVSLPGHGDYIQVTASIQAGKAGQVRVGMDRAGIKSIMRGAILRQEALMLGMFALAVAVFYTLVGSITQPLVELARYAVKIRDHDFSAKPPKTADDEVGILARAMEDMAGQLALLVSDLKLAVTETTRELQDALANIQAIIDNLADGLLVVDAQGRIALHNPALLAMFGRTAQEVAGKTVAEAFPKALAALAAAAGTSGHTPWAEVLLASGGTGKAVATVLRPGSDPGGARAATILLVRDITAEKEVDRMKTEFISTVSHELRTPLTSVLGFAKIIRRKFQEVVVPALPAGETKARRGVAQIGDNLDIIVAEGERLTELVDDVLDIAKMEAGRYEWNMVALSLEGVVGQALKTVGPLAARKNLNLMTAVPPDLPSILGDKDRLMQVFLNLIGNAVKFTEAGGIRVTAQLQGEVIQVAVRDTGSGIEEEDLERIFEKFRQAGDTLTEKPKGTGLGLPICRQIIERHGGRIWAESRPGSGSDFIFTLPVAASPRVPEVVKSVEAAQEEADGRRRILVVDDDAAVRQYLETVFVDAGYAVSQARDGNEALARAGEWRPECITMDLHMPGMGGEEVIRQLRADEKTRGIPVVVVSVSSRRGAAKSGADAAMVKPVEEEALLDTVRGLLEGQNASGARPCLLYARDGSGNTGRRFFMCPGEVTALSEEADLWRTLEGGFRGTVFVPASLGHELDLARLSAFPGVHAIIIPD